MVNAHISREYAVYYEKSFRKDIPTSVDTLSGAFWNSKPDSSAVEHERDVILDKQQEVDEQLYVVLDHIHTATFRKLSFTGASSYRGGRRLRTTGP